MKKGKTYKVVGSKQGTISHHRSEYAAQKAADRQNRLWKGKERFTVEVLDE